MTNEQRLEQQIELAVGTLLPCEEENGLNVSLQGRGGGRFFEGLEEFAAKAGDEEDPLLGRGVELAQVAVGKGGYKARGKSPGPREPPIFGVLAELGGNASCCHPGRAARARSQTASYEG